MTTIDPLKDLESALSILPSPAFTARVRARIATGPTRRRAGGWWPWISVAATAAVVTLATLPVWRGPSASTAVPAAELTPVVPGDFLTETNVTTPPVPGPSAAPKPVVSDAGVAAARPVRAEAGSFTEVLVSGDQRIALERLLLGIRTGRASVPAEGSVADTEIDADGHLVLRALSIAWLEITPMAGPSADAKDPNKGENR